MAKQPIYRHIANHIQSQISEGHLSAGDAISTEAELCKQFNASRVTVRQAIKMLIEENILESIQGSGTYVKKAPIDYNIYDMTGFEEKFEHAKQHARSEILNFEIIIPPKNILNILHLNENDKVYFIKRVRLIENRPITLEETWMPLYLFSDLTYEVMKGSKYHYIEDQKGMTIDRSDQEILAIMPNEDTCHHLNISPKIPIIEKISIGYLADGTVFEYSKNFFKSSEYKFTLTSRRRTLSK